MAPDPTLKAGDLGDLAGSMAAAIERAYDLQLAARDRPPVAAGGEEADYVRMLFVAVAQGVVNHLHENPEAFVSESVEVDGTSHRHEIESIGRRGPVLG